MDRLLDAPELLDGPLDDPAALAGNLRDLGRVNRWLGGVRLSAAAIGALAPGDAGRTMIDVGTGGADIPLELARRFARRGQQWSITALDSRSEVIAAAFRTRPDLASTPGLRLVVGDGRRLDEPDQAYDIAHCSLVLHHLEPRAAVDLLAEMARVARHGVVVNDLDRNPLAWLGAWLLGHVLTRNRYTRNDAPLSVRRAYRVPEVVELLGAAGLTPIRTFHGFLGHRYAIAAVVRSPG
jgi:ubiquinone/menaquinone biosynthesis C-methylase UbiE